MKKTVVTGLLAATAVAYWLRFAGTSSHSGVEQAEGAAVHEMRGNPRGIRKLPSTFTAIQFTDRSKGMLVVREPYDFTFSVGSGEICPACSERCVMFCC